VLRWVGGVREGFVRTGDEGALLTRRLGLAPRAFRVHDVASDALHLAGIEQPTQLQQSAQPDQSREPYGGRSSR